MRVPSFDIAEPETPDFAERKVLVGLLMAVNDDNGGATGHAPYALLLRDHATGQTIGGL